MNIVVKMNENFHMLFKSRTLQAKQRCVSVRSLSTILWMCNNTSIGESAKTQYPLKWDFLLNIMFFEKSFKKTQFFNTHISTFDWELPAQNIPASMLIHMLLLVHDSISCNLAE